MSLRTPAVYRHFFMAALIDVRKAKADYEAEVKDWYENGDGRAPDWRTESDDEGNTWRYNAGGLGYAFPHCIHGSSLWTDYDNICPGCEDSLSDLAMASIAARQAFIRFNDMFDWVTAAPAAVPHEIRSTLFDLTIALFPKKD